MSQDHVTEGPSNIMGRRPPTLATILLSMVTMGIVIDEI